MSKQPCWRFEDLEIWQVAVDLAVKFHQVADTLERRRVYCYAKQLRGAGLPWPNQSHDIANFSCAPTPCSNDLQSDPNFTGCDFSNRNRG